MKGFGKVRAGAALAASGAILSFAATAEAQRPADLGIGAPSGAMGVQLFTFSQYLSSGAGEIVCDATSPPSSPCAQPPAPTTTAGRLSRVFAYLQSRGVQNVELYGYPGNPFPSGGNPTGNLDGMRDLKTLGDSYGIRFPSRHGNLTEATWDNEIAAAKILGQDMIGAADPPNAGSTDLATHITNAQRLNRLGKKSVEAGVGPAYFHNHASSFTATVVDNGVSKPMWQVLMERTESRWVKAQIDLGWAVSGYTAAGVSTLLTNFTNANPNLNRVTSFHVKDVVNPVPSSNSSSLRALGEGDINFAPFFLTSRDRVKHYHYEYDPVAIGSSGGFNPFTAADRSFSALRGDPAGLALISKPSWPATLAGTAASNNTSAVTVKNTGDAPLTFTGNPTISADNLDGGNTTAGDFSVVSQTCFTAGNPAPPSNTIAPGASCTINVGFKPTRTNYTSVARLNVPGSGDNAWENQLLVGNSTGDYIQTVGGDVPATLNLAIPNQPGSFGTFQPLITKLYETAIAASVTSTAGDGTLTVTDTSATSPGYLVNGTFALPQALQVRARNLANPAAAYQPMSATPTTLVTYTGPVNQDQVTVGFAQQINSTDVLRTGNYSKVLTFTLSTTQP